MSKPEYAHRKHRMKSNYGGECPADKKHPEERKDPTNQSKDVDKTLQPIEEEKHEEADSK